MDQFDAFLMLDLPAGHQVGASQDPLTARDVQLLAQLDAVLLPPAVRLRDFSARDLAGVARDDVAGLADRWVQSAAARGLVHPQATDRGARQWRIQGEVAIPRVTELLAERTARRETV